VTILRKKYDRNKYDFRDAKCLEADCFQPGEYHHRGATSSGSRATGKTSACCMRRAYHGCPNDVVYLPETAKERKKEGWRVQR
jgi:hypothetical protein